MSEQYIEKGTNIDQCAEEPPVDQREIITAELVQYTPRRRRVWLPIGLFFATCLTTSLVGCWEWGFVGGIKYSAALMTILICHEAGHFLQARRHGVHASFPFFIPLPAPPLGTFGAVIGMEAHRGDRKALFDIGISGPLAGLVPTLIFCVIGLSLSEAITTRLPPDHMDFGAPILFNTLSDWLVEPVANQQRVDWHPMAFAGWVGLLITALNLIPIGQLDGGHVLYALLRRKAHAVATLLLLGALVAVTICNMSHWLLMVFLLIVMGPNHPPTADDNVPLGLGRTILGWLTLAFVIIGFTPVPIFFS